MEPIEIDGFRLISELGSGAMGRVHRAEVLADRPGLPAGTQVALKWIHPELARDPEYLRRFRREAELGAAVASRNVVRTYACGAAAGPTPALYIVMELVEGRNLRELLLEMGRAPEALVRHVAAEIAFGLAAIHAAGAVHRDLKPENVLVTPDHEVKVMDLGVARSAAGSRLSRSGAFLGSLLYAAPEQITGAETVDGRADLYSLGVILHELTTGEPPFAEEEVAKLIAAVLAEPPPPLAARAPEASPFLCEVTATLLAKSRAERFGSAGELALVLAERERSAWWRERSRRVRAAGAPPPRRAPASRRAPFVGRAAELDALRALLDEAAAGRGRVALLIGESGAGKSRLVEEFAARSGSRPNPPDFLQGAYAPGAADAGAFVLALGSRLSEGGLEEELGRALAAAPQLAGPFAAFLRGESGGPGGEPLRRESLLTAIVLLLRSLGETRPVVLAVEDLQHAPDEGLALFAALSRAAAGLPLLLLGTVRGAAVERVERGLLDLPHFRRIDVATLSDLTIEELFRAAGVAGSVPREYRHELLARIGGNPLFALQTAALAMERGGRWPAALDELPVSIEELFDARLDRLAAPDLDLVETAAAAGFRFDPVLVAEALTRPAIPVLMRLAALERTERLLRPSGRRFEFAHHSIHRRILDRLPRERLAARHAALGRALDRRAGVAAEGEIAAATARHLVIGGEAARAARHLEAAFRWLSRRYLSEELTALAEAAVASPDLPDEERIAAHLAAAESYGLLGRTADRQAHLERALEVADRGGAAGPRALVRCRRARAFTDAGRLSEAIADYEEALALAESAGDRRNEWEALNGLDGVLRYAGRPAEARERGERALAIAEEIGDDWMRANSLSQAAYRRREEGRLDEAAVRQREAIELLRSTGRRFAEGIATGNLGWIEVRRGRLPEAVQAFERAIAIARDLGHTAGEGWAADLGSLKALLGDYEAARELGVRAAAVSGAAGEPLWEGFGLDAQGLAAEQTGDLAFAAALYARALSIHRACGAAFGLAPSLIHAGRVAAATGRRAEARALLAEARQVAEAAGEEGDALLARALLAELAGDLSGDPDLPAAVAAAAARIGLPQEMAIRHRLWRAGGGPGELARAAEILDGLSARLPPAERDRMRERPPEHREILAARGKPANPGGSPGAR